MRTILFVCVENACRSLMAEAMFNARAPAGWRALSAGTEPAREPNPRTASMLSEIGFAMPGHDPRPLTEELAQGASRKITMGCLDRTSCPAYLGGERTEDWGLPDPGPLDDDGFRAVRDELRLRVERLIGELAKDGPSRPRA